MSRTLEENYGMSATAGAVIGSIASGLIAATLSHPLDTIKTCMQGDVERKRYHNMRQTVRFFLFFFVFENVTHTHTHTQHRQEQFTQNMVLAGSSTVGFGVPQE